MNKLVFLSDPSVSYEGELTKVNSNVLRVTFTSKVPAKKALVSGMNIINEHNGKVMASKEDFKTIYRTYEDNSKVIELSNDGSVWTKPMMKVTFSAGNGGELDGEATQEVYKFEDLKVPTPVAGENYKFERWSPEVPTNGEVECDKTFVAMFEYVPTEE